jgi:F-type H+-transporting ATPase subunit delta
MTNEAIAKRYARAFFEAAAERDLLDRMGDELRALVELLRQHATLRQVLAAPHVAERGKRELLAKALAGKVHPLLLELLYLLLDKKRFDLLGEIFEGYHRMLEERRGDVRVVVTTARELAPDLEQKLVARLRARTGKNVLIEKKIDPGILGGIIVRIRERVLDASIRRSLQEMREALREVEIHG